MAKTLNALLDEADKLIESKLSTKIAADDEVVKLAEQLKAVSKDEYTLTEKLAHAIALVDTFLNLDHLVKVAAFEEKARTMRVPEEKISQFFEKNATRKFKSALDLL